jgi:hypothetical protein
MRYEMEKYRGYKIDQLRDRFRSLSLLKNRDGESDKVVGLRFIGEIGFFEELPRAELLTDEGYAKIISI